MKNLVKWAAIGLVLVIGLLIAVPFFIPVETCKRIAIERVKAMTGRDLVIGGDAKVSLWPNIGVNLEQVTLSNASGYSDKNMVEVGGLTVKVALLPMLHGQVEIKQFILNKPVVHLEVDKSGIANWQFSTAKQPATKATSASSKSSIPTIPTLGQIKIVDGTFTYHDIRSGTVYNADEANLSVTMPSYSAPVDVTGNLTWNKQTVDLTLHADSAEQLTSGDEGPVKAEFKIGSLLSFKLDGKASAKAMSGKLSLSAPSLVELSGWAGKDLNWHGATPLALGIQGTLACSASQCSFNKADFTLDSIKTSGDIKVAFGGSVPAIDATLSTDTLDLNPYLSKTGKQASLSLTSDAQAAENWSTDAIDLSGLRAANAHLSLSANTLLYQAMTFTKIALELQINNGVLTLSVPHVELYSGTAKLAAAANADNAVSASLSAENIDMSKLLKDAANFDRLSGTGAFSTSITAQGKSQHDMVASLAGKGDMHITNGTIRGIDIEQVIRNAKAFVTGDSTSSQKTAFSELGGTYTIDKGIVTNNDLAMKGSMQIRGNGTVNLPQHYVNYRLIPGSDSYTSIDVPILVEGNFDSLTFRPDVAGIARDALKSPEKIVNTVKSFKGSGVKNLLQGLGR